MVATVQPSERQKVFILTFVSLRVPSTASNITYSFGTYWVTAYSGRATSRASSDRTIVPTIGILSMSSPARRYRDGSSTPSPLWYRLSNVRGHLDSGYTHVCVVLIVCGGLKERNLAARASDVIAGHSYLGVYLVNVIWQAD